MLLAMAATIALVTLDKRIRYILIHNIEMDIVYIFKPKKVCIY